MFYNLNLDDKSYQEIEADAVFQIPGECPDWTNYNQSDPGIMLLGLLSWLKEIQQYHISQLCGWKRQKYLKLFGVSMECARPALGAVSVELPAGRNGRETPLLKGTRFFADDMAFETVRKEWPYPIHLMGAYLLSGELLDKYVNIGNDLEKQMRLHPFGEFPIQGNCCCFIMDRAFCPKSRTTVTFDIRTDYEVSRNPIGEDFIPLAELKWEYQSEEGWQELLVEFDTTYAFLQSGRIGFYLPGEMAEDETYGAFQIRVTLTENHYDVAPLIQNIYFNEIEVRQQYSYCDYEDYELEISDTSQMLSITSGMYLAKNGQTELYLERDGGWIPARIIRKEETKEGDCLLFFARPVWARGRLACRLAAYEDDFLEKRELGTGRGYANQEYPLDMEGIVCDEFELMVCDRRDGRFYPFRRVSDFDNCMPEDAVYVLEPEENRLRFGSCENGMAPDGEIRLLRLKVSQGKSGNIKAGKIRECQAYPDLLVRQYESAKKGRDNETVEECFERLRRELKSINRGVTSSDYEELIRQTPGLLILDSKVVAPAEGTDPNQVPENEISIVVRPLSYRKRDNCLNEKYRQNLEQMLRKRKMIGTSVKLLNPEYVGISVFAEIVIRPQFTDAELMIEEAAQSFLDETSWEIGRPVSSSEIYGIIDMLPCVQQVRSLSVEARGRGFRHLVNGDVKLPPNGLPFLKEMDFRIFTAGENW